MSVQHSKLRILCLHGYRQNAEIFRQRLGAFRKIVKSYADLVFVSAPLIVPQKENSEQADGQRGWWFSREDDYFDAKDSTSCAKGFEESLNVIKDAFEKNGPIDGLLGFSQGAAMVAILCEMLETEEFPFAFNSAILVAGFQSLSEYHKRFFQKNVKIQTLHVFGKTDQVIPIEMSQSLLQHFNNPTTVEHDGGHYVPTSGLQKKSYIDFLNQILDKNEAVHVAN